MSAGYAAGLLRVLIWRLATGGFAAGTAGNDLANNSGSGAYVIDDPKTSNFAFVDPTILPINGGDKQGRANIPFSNVSFGKFQITAATLDPDLFAALNNGVAVNNTVNSTHNYFGIDVDADAPVAVGVMISQRFQSKDGGSDAATRYFHTILPYCFASIRPGAPSYQAEAPITIDITPNKTTKFYTGAALGSAGLDMGFSNDRSDHVFDITDYPVHVYTWKQGAATSFILPYLPLSSVVTLGSSPNFFNVDGTPTALSAVNTSTGECTLAAAGTAGKFDVLTYTTRFIEPA